jgi:peptide/nickel transport system ATP-binding protein
MSHLFISKDLNVAKKICDRIAIMHEGRIVEIGQAKTIMENPKSEYAREFLDSIL